MRTEFGEGFDHLRQAAGHAAGSFNDTMGPRVAAVRVYVKPANVREAATHGWDSTVSAFAPLAAAAKDGAHQARKAQEQQLKKLKKQFKKESSMSRKRWPMLVGLLAAGAAVGAASAVVVRRRRRMQWDEYDADRALEAVDSAKSSFDRAADKTGEAMSSGLGSAKERAQTATETAKRQAGKVADKADDLITKAGSPSKNNAPQK